MAPLMISGSVARTSKSIPPTSCDAAAINGMPIARPAIINVNDSRNTIHSTRGRGAPSAKRIASSDVRCFTAYVIRP